MTNGIKIGRCTTIYTDSPSQVEVLPGGLIETESDCSVFIRWQVCQMSQSEHPSETSPLAIRWVANGRRIFESERQRFAVDDSSYLVFNADRPFSSFVRSAVPVDCFTVGFQPCLVDDVLRSLIIPADHLLDDPKRPVQPIRFLEQANPHDDLVSPGLCRLQSLNEDVPVMHGWLDEQFRHILVGMLYSHRDMLRRIEQVPATRASTRIELYRRLQQARDFIEAGLDQELTLPQIAQAAWFSPHHFLRLFKQTFHETPHQYLTRRRLERAQQLLRSTNMSITEICYTVGFQSLGSFSWLFHRRIGISPENYREQTRRPLFSHNVVEEHRLSDDASLRERTE